MKTTFDGRLKGRQRYKWVDTNKSFAGINFHKSTVAARDGQTLQAKLPGGEGTCDEAWREMCTTQRGRVDGDYQVVQNTRPYAEGRRRTWGGHDWKTQGDRDTMSPTMR